MDERITCHVTSECDSCIHKAVCSIYIATGGVNRCEHHKEERKGRWEYHWFDAYCSECGYENKPNAVTRVRDDPAFCPKCGADMRGEKDENT